MKVAAGWRRLPRVGFPAILLHLILFGIIIGLLSGFLLGCSGSGGGTETGNPKIEMGAQALAAFSSDAEAEVYLKKSHAENVLPAEVYDSEREDWVEDPAFPAPDAGDSPPLSDPASNSGGILSGNAEPVQSDDGILYVAGDRRVAIVQGLPAPGMEIAGAIDVSGAIIGLHRFGNTLGILYRPDRSASLEADLSKTIGTPGWVAPGVRTGLLLADVSDPSAPARIQEMLFDGTVVAARQQMGTLRLIGQFIPDLPELDRVYESQSEQETAVERNRQMLEGYGIRDLLPRYERKDAQGNADFGLLVGADSLYRPDVNAGGSICYILSIALNAPRQPFSAVGLAADVHGWHITPDNRTVYLGANHLRDRDGDLSFETLLFKFEAENGELMPAATGQVQGHLLDPLSMDASGQRLRIATGAQLPEAAANLFIIEEQIGEEEHRLIPIAQLELPASPLPQWVRFDGAIGYLYAENSTESLWLLDLSVPAAPQLAESISVSGKPFEMLNYQEDRLLVISGKGSAFDGGASPGLHLSLFDIGLLDSPLLLDTVEIPGASMGSGFSPGGSSISIHSAGDLLAIPVVMGGEGVDETATEFFQGIALYRITGADAFALVGRISTLFDGTDREKNPWSRAIIQEDEIYAMGPDGIRAAPIEDIETLLQEIGLSAL